MKKRLLTLAMLVGLLCAPLASLFAEDIPIRGQRREVFRACPIDDETIVFLGNSITHFGTWPEFFGTDVKVVNRGISGNYSGEVADHLDFILEGKPAKLFVMIGINDNNNPEVIVPNIRRIIRTTKRESPNTEIYIQSLLPCNRDDRHGMVEGKNEELKQLCTEEGVTYIDVYSKIVDKSTTPPGIGAAYTNDNLHVTGPGYRAWVSDFEQYIGKPSAFLNGNATPVNGLNTVENMLLTTFQLLPVPDGAMLHIGDYNVKTGEWAELMQNTKFLNRGLGLGWGYTLTISSLKLALPHIVKGNPSKIFLQVGAKDLGGGATADATFTAYKEAVNQIKTLAPNAEIYMQSVIPFTDANLNTTVEAFNAKVKALADESNTDKLFFADVYTALAENGVLAERYRGANTNQSKGINGRGYLRWANCLNDASGKTMSPLAEPTDAQFALSEAIAEATRLKYVAVVGTEAGNYSQAALDGVATAIASAKTALKNGTATDMTNATAALTTALDAMAAGIVLPEASTASNEVWYRLFTPQRNYKYIEGQGAAQGLMGRDANNLKKQQWKFVKRSDNTYNIINRADGTYISTTVASGNNQPVPAVTDKPSAGWTITGVGATGDFILSCGNVQLHQANAGNNWKIINYGGGTNNTDAGCIYRIERVTTEPDPDPEDLFTYNDLNISFTGAAFTGHNLLPKPNKIVVNGSASAFSLNRSVKVESPFNTKLLNNFLTENGCTVDANSEAVIKVVQVDDFEYLFNHELAEYGDERYILSIDGNRILIFVTEELGVIRATQTLMQLADGGSVPAVNIADYPAFKLRGFMHDVGRSFISFEELKNQIDKLSRFKVNTFHWHLTDYTGWRIEVKAYPQLTDGANQGRYPGQFYTQEQAAELVAYAKERGMVIIPEIDMPGHSHVFSTAMGYDMQTDAGVAALKTILDELCETFEDCPYIHIGGDEVRITYANFLETMSAYIRAKGQKVVMWNPLVGQTPAANFCDMTQMWSTSGRVVAGLPNIDCRYNYTNHFDVYADLVGIYKSSIYYADKGTADIAGTISAAWNDTKTKTEDDITRQNNIYANILASTERAWIGGGKQYIEVGGTTLPNSGAEFDEFADFERRFLYHKANVLKNEPIAYVKQTNVRWRITDAFPNGGSNTLQLPPELANDDILPESFTYNGQEYGTYLATGAGIYLRHIWHPTVPSFLKNPGNNQTAYAWTYVYSPEAQNVGAQIEFYTYSRSGNENQMIAGQWDRRGSKIWLNGTEIAAPQWEQTGGTIHQNHATEELKNENLTARPVVQLHLNKGWNKVFMRLPHVNSGGHSRDKWQFTFVITDTEGKNALEGLIYSPTKSMDEKAELIAAKISEIKREKASYIGTEPGYYNESITAGLDAVIAAIEETLSNAMTAEEREAQIEELDAALAAMKASCTESNMVQPVASSGTNSAYYLMRTPLRENKYPTSKGVGAEIIGESTAVAASYWKFVLRADGKFDIVNYADDSFISPNSANNTALRTVAAQPSSGWTIKPADAPGYVIITNNSVQFNQTNSGLSYKLYNWGSGTNTTDAGCKYIMQAVPASQLPEKPEGPEASEAPTPFIALTGLEGNTYPYKLTEAQEAEIFSKENITIAFDLTTSGTSNTNEAFFAASDPTDAGQGTVVGTSKFISVGAYNQQLRFYVSAQSGQWYTRGSGVTTNTNHKIVVVLTKNAGAKCYVNGTAFDSGLQQDLYHFASNTNANFYIGGGVTSSGNTYQFKGQIHSVQFFDKAMTSDEIATIDYNVATTGKKLTVTANKALADAQFGWNGESKTSGAAFVVADGGKISEATLTLESYNPAFKFTGFYSDASYTTYLGTEVEIATLEANRNIYAKFELNILSATFGEKTLRLKMYRDNAYVASAIEAANFDGAKATTRISDISRVSDLWYLVGTEAGFIIQNKAAGADYALKVPSTADGAAATLTAKADATTWVLVEKDGGYAITPANATSMSLNAYGGKGNDMKLYSANDAGGWWVFDLIDNNTLTIAAKISGTQPYPVNTRVAEMTFTINGTSETTRLYNTEVARTYYLPVNSTFTIATPSVYRGYVFDNFADANGNTIACTNATIPAGGLTVNAKFSVDADNKYQYLYYSNDEVINKPYRIPAIAVTKDGTVLAVSDHRPCGNDIGAGEVDIKIRRTTDYVNWTEEEFIANGVGGNANVFNVGFGDAAIVADRESNEVLIMCVAGKQWFTSGTATSHNQTARLRSHDGGVTWDEAENVTGMFMDISSMTVESDKEYTPILPSAYSMFFASGRICQSRVYKAKGSDYYRLYSAILVREPNNGGTRNANYVVYSDDFGGTWNLLGGACVPNGDEAKVEELPDGNIIISSRKSYGRYFNKFTFTDIAAAEGSWASPVQSNSQTGGIAIGSNSCNGEILKISAIRKSDNTVCDIMLQSLPTGNSREKVAIYYKEMDYTTAYTPTTFAQNWTKGLEVSDRGSAYSTMTVQADGKIGFFYEEEPNAYCMVYVPLTVEEITNGKYSLNDDPTTGIGSIVNEVIETTDNAIYDLTGRKITEITRSGIYIINGNKVIIKK